MVKKWGSLIEIKEMHPYVGTLTHKKVIYSRTAGTVMFICCLVAPPPPPQIISPMAAVPKPDGDVCLIHDPSRPSGKWLFRLETEILPCRRRFGFNDRRVFFAKVDLKHAYRPVKISEHSQNATGLKWKLNGTDV